MSLLHYRLSKFARAWVVSCEGVPIERFDSRAAAVQAADRLVETARSRGDQTVIHFDKPVAEARA